jgi:hypothetical protein
MESWQWKARVKEGDEQKGTNETNQTLDLFIKEKLL